MAQSNLEGYRTAIYKPKSFLKEIELTECKFKSVKKIGYRLELSTPGLFIGSV
jgi:hypothetical protein